MRKVGDKLRMHASSSIRGRQFTKLFCKLDTDRTGQLTPAEITTGRASLGGELTESGLQIFLSGADLNADGLVAVDEFTQAMGASVKFHVDFTVSH